jgi:hypothetical protein
VPGRVVGHQRRRRGADGARDGAGAHHRDDPVRLRHALSVQALQPRLPARERACRCLVFREPARNAGGVGGRVSGRPELATPRGSDAGGADRGARPGARGWQRRARRDRRTPRGSGGSAGRGACPADQRHRRLHPRRWADREIDALLRDRQQQQLLQLDPSPPTRSTGRWRWARCAIWPSRSRARSPTALPTGPSGSAGGCAPGSCYWSCWLLAVFRGRRWTDALTERLQARATDTGAHGGRVPGVASADHGAAGGRAAASDGGVGVGHGRAAGPVSSRRSPVLPWRSTCRSGSPGGCSGTTPTPRSKLLRANPAAPCAASWSSSASPWALRCDGDADGPRSGRACRPWRSATAGLRADGLSLLARPVCSGPISRIRPPRSCPVSPRAR